MNRDLYEYLLMAGIAAVVVISWFGMRRATARRDMGGRRRWLLTTAIAAMFLAITIIAQFVDIQQDVFSGIILAVAIIAGLVARAIGERGSNGKKRNKKN
jgi:hypothetical protein